MGKVRTKIKFSSARHRLLPENHIFTKNNFSLKIMFSPKTICYPKTIFLPKNHVFIKKNVFTKTKFSPITVFSPKLIDSMWWPSTRSTFTSVWPQQTVRPSCLSSMINEIRLEPTNKRFNSGYLQIKYPICRKIHSNTFGLDETFSCWSQVTMMF